MQAGQILVADHNGISVIKMIGDVRLTLCISFDKFIEEMYQADNFKTVLFDLSQAEAIDSTTLGLMAKISILGFEQHGVKPMVLSTNESINRILETMGFSDIFIIVDHLNEVIPVESCAELKEECAPDDVIKTKVIEAHKILMDLNQNNKETFTNLVNMLETN